MDMASLCAARPFQLSLGFHRPSSAGRAVILTIDVLKLSPNGFPASDFRFNGNQRLQLRQRLKPISASNSSGGGLTKEERESTRTNDTAQGPPFLTILAGFFVLFLIGWVVSSVVMWLLGLILNLASPK